MRVFEIRGSHPTEIIRIDRLRHLECGAAGCGRVLSSTPTFSYDLTGGLLHITNSVQITDCQTGQTLESDRGVVTISGFPQLFDTLLTFLPAGQTLSILTPAHPDGLRSADAFQLWAGDVRTLPDWSQVAPLTCSAATNPVPGQLLSVTDTFPDPTPGRGRYYILASRSGGLRRLGRQYVDGAFSARDPNSLAVCQ